MSEGANAELIRRVFAEANRVAEVGGFGAWLDFFSEEIVWEAAEDAPDAGTYRGHEGIRAYFEDWLATVDGFHNELRALMEPGTGRRGRRPIQRAHEGRRTTRCFSTTPRRV